MIIDYSIIIFYHAVITTTLYDQLNYNLHSCNYTNQYICYFNNSIFAVIQCLMVSTSHLNSYLTDNHTHTHKTHVMDEYINYT